MTGNDVKRLALVLALQAEIEGMKVQNKLHEANNYPYEYNNGHFQGKAEELRNLAYTHDLQLFG